jgi:hypothetical protein
MRHSLYQSEIQLQGFFYVGMWWSFPDFFPEIFAFKVSKFDCEIPSSFLSIKEAIDPCSIELAGSAELAQDT